MTELTVAEIAALCGVPLEGEDLAAHGARRVSGPAALDEAGPDEVSFLGNMRYAPALATTRACCVLVPEGTEAERDDLALLPCENPNRAFTRLVEAFRPPEPRPAAGVHAGAHVDPSAALGADVAVGAGVVVGAEARIGARVVLHPGVVVGPGAVIGDESVLHPGVVVAWGVQVGARCVVHANAVLGSDGFGFEPTPEGWEKIPQCGTVVVEDDVEIGANATVDRARFGATRIQRGAKLDNLVQVAHNVVIGPHALLIAQAGVAGSSKLGSWAILAGQVGVAGHVTVGDGARVAAQSGVSKDLAGGGDYFGSPARPQGEAYRILREYGRLPELAKRLRALEVRLAELEGASSPGQGGRS